MPNQLRRFREVLNSSMRGFLFPATSMVSPPSARPLPLYTETSHVRRKRRAAEQHVCGQYSNTLWPEERCDPRLCDLAFGSYFPAPCPNPQGAGADRLCCLLPTACLKANSTLRRETWETRLPRGDAIPEV